MLHDMEQDIGLFSNHKNINYYIIILEINIFSHTINANKEIEDMHKDVLNVINILIK